MIDKETKQKVFQQVMDIFITPEIERRRKEGSIKDGTIITKMQIVFSLDTGKNEVRLNDEVKAIVKAKANKPIQKREIVYETDISAIEDIELTDEDLNCGHITLLLFKDNWTISFDFRYNKEILECRNHKKRLSQFKNWADLGNVKMEFSTTLSGLSKLRDSARYLHSDKFKEENPNKIKSILKEMIDFAEESIK